MDVTSNPINNKKQIKIFYTLLLFIGQIAFGLTSGIYGPTLVDLAYLFNNEDFNSAINSNEEKLPEMGSTSLFFTFMCGGCITGALFSGLYKYDLTKRYLNRQLLTSIFLMLASACHCFIPQMRSIKLFYLLAYGSGFGVGILNAVVTTWLMELWTGKRLASILQAAQLMYGLGSTFAPVLVRSFIYGYEDLHKTYISSIETPINISTRRQQLTIPYVTSGSFQFIVGSVLLVLFFCVRYNNNEDCNEFDRKSNSIRARKILDLDCHRSKRILFHILMTFLFITYNFAEIEFSSFQNTYFQKQKIDAKHSADLASIGAAAFTFGRGINVIITRFLSITMILYGHLILNIIGFIGLYLIQYLGYMKLWILMINCVVIGYAQSAITPALFGFIDVYTQVDDRHNSIYFTAIGLPMLFAPIIIGHYIHQMPNIVVYLALGPIIITLLLYILIKTLINFLK